MNISHKENEERGVFFIEENNEKLAQLVYSKPNSHQIVIEHTEVNKALRGNHLGFSLVERAVDYAREQHLKIVPLCAFAKAVFERESDFDDVRA